MTPPTVFAYLAGVIDSDGFITITRSVHKGVVYHGATIGISGTRRQPHDLASETWGGNVRRYVPPNPRHRPVFQWALTGRRVVPILHDLLPYLRVKRDHAELALQVQEDLAEARSDDPFPWFGPDFDVTARLDLLRADLVEINQWRRCAADGATVNADDNRRAVAR